MRLFLLSLLFVSALWSQQPASPPETKSAELDALFAPWTGNDRPGAALVVTRNGTLVAIRSYGMANLEHERPIDAETVFDIASLSKQFAGYLIAQEEAAGRLNRNEFIREYLPDLPAAMAKIRLHHLIHHESGLRDWPGALAAAGFRMDDVISEARLRNFLGDQRALNFSPGEEHLYSNTGYNVLAWILEARGPGVDYAELLRRRIFAPLEMTASYSQRDSRRLAPARADAYRRGPRQTWLRVHNGLSAPASSSVHTTAGDFARWMMHLQTPGEEAAAIVKAMSRTGRHSGYAYGQVRHRTAKGRERWQHTGSWAGFRSALIREPKSGMAVAVLGNAGDLPARRLAEEVLELFAVPKSRAQKAATPKPRPRPPEQGPKVAPKPPEKDLAGHYYSAELGATVEIRLRAETAVLEWIRADGESARLERGKDRYRSPSWWCREVAFLRDAEGRVTGLHLHQGRNRNLHFRRRS